MHIPRYKYDSSSNYTDEKYDKIINVMLYTYVYNIYVI